MRRAPSPRELVAVLLASDDERAEAQELTEVLVSHVVQLADSLHVSQAQILALAELDPSSRSVRLRDLVRAAKERDQSTHASAMQNLALAAASLLAMSARWEDGYVTLDARIMLGRNLRADSGKKFIRLDVEGFEPITIRREKLSEACKSLSFADLTCSLERSGLRFRWGQAGWLRLVTQKVEPRHRDAVLTVVVPRPRAAQQEPHPFSSRERSPRWLGDVLNELNLF